MAQVVTEYERSLEEFGRRSQVEMLCDMTSRKFGPEPARALRVLLGTTSESGRISAAASAVIECATAEEFLARLR